jgi:dinuclear metal center YbgI/SA1388 family protein
MIKIKDIIGHLERLAPSVFQESYDNSGLLTGNREWDLKGVLVTLDITEDIIREAIDSNANLIISHHPIIFKGLKKLTGANYVERCIIDAIKNDVAIFAIHTNLDSVSNGVNKIIGERLGIKETKILAPRNDTLAKLVTFSPPENTMTVLAALHEAGAGMIGNYERCSYRVSGKGTFKPVEGADPHIGKVDKLEEVTEERIEVQFPRHKKDKILRALVKAHPYEEVAHFIQDLSNTEDSVGAGMFGELADYMEVVDFLALLKRKLSTNVIRHTDLVHKQVKKVAWCGGSGSFLLSKAISIGAQIFISADFKYHDFFGAEDRIIIADIGHYESEQFTKELIYKNLRENFSNIALHLSKVNTNPIIYA